MTKLASTRGGVAVERVGNCSGVVEEDEEVAEGRWRQAGASVRVRVLVEKMSNISGTIPRGIFGDFCQQYFFLLLNLRI